MWLEGICHPKSSFPLSARVQQEVMLEAGSGAVKGKEAANTFGLYEVTSRRKETCSAATGTMSLCLFSLTVSQKTLREKEKVEEGTTGMYFEEMCAKHL